MTKYFRSSSEFGPLLKLCLPISNLGPSNQRSIINSVDYYQTDVCVQLQVQAEAKNFTWYNEHVMEARMAWRRRTLKEACSRYGLDVPGNDSLHRPNAWEFLINKQHHLIWCNIFKAASSSWMYNFNILAGTAAEGVLVSCTRYLSPY